MMVTQLVMESSAVDLRFELRSGQTKNYETGICCFSVNHASLTWWVKAKNCLLGLATYVHGDSGAGTAYPSGAPEFILGFSWGSCYSIFSFMCMFCRSLFVLLYFFFRPLCFLFLFDIDIWRLKSRSCLETKFIAKIYCYRQR
jgi:hypothetical protein